MSQEAQTRAVSRFEPPPPPTAQKNYRWQRTRHRHRQKQDLVQKARKPSDLDTLELAAQEGHQWHQLKSHEIAGQMFENEYD